MRLYRALLHLYPAGFRAEYAEDLCALFALRRARASNPLAVLALWLEAIADTCSSALPAHWDILRRDLVWSARSLRRSPAFTLTAVTVSALGIGATTADFTLADHVLLRPLPYADSARLVKIWEDTSSNGYSREDPSSLLPLPTAAFHILLAVADEDRHGYAIIQDVAARTGGALKLSAGTLYRSIQRMLEQGLLVEPRQRPLPELDDERRRYYRITPFGRTVAEAESRRLSQLVRMARDRGFSPGRA